MPEQYRTMRQVVHAETKAGARLMVLEGMGVGRSLIYYVMIETEMGWREVSRRKSKRAAYVLMNRVKEHEQHKEEINMNNDTGTEESIVRGERYQTTITRGVFTVSRLDPGGWQDIFSSNSIGDVNNFMADEMDVNDARARESQHGGTRLKLEKRDLMGDPAWYIKIETPEGKWLDVNEIGYALRHEAQGEIDFLLVAEERAIVELHKAMNRADEAKAKTRIPASDEMKVVERQEITNPPAVIKILEGPEGIYYLTVESEGRADEVVCSYTAADAAAAGMSELLASPDTLRRIIENAAKKPPMPKEKKATFSDFLSLLRESASRAIDKELPSKGHDWSGAGIIAGTGLVIISASIYATARALRRAIDSGGALGDVISVPLTWLAGGAVNVAVVKIVAKRLER